MFYEAAVRGVPTPNETETSLLGVVNESSDDQEFVAKIKAASAARIDITNKRKRPRHTVTYADEGLLGHLLQNPHLKKDPSRKLKWLKIMLEEHPVAKSLNVRSGDTSRFGYNVPAFFTMLELDEEEISFELVEYVLRWVVGRQLSKQEMIEGKVNHLKDQVSTDHEATALHHMMRKRTSERKGMGPEMIKIMKLLVRYLGRDAVVKGHGRYLLTPLADAALVGNPEMVRLMLRYAGPPSAEGIDLEECPMTPEEINFQHEATYWGTGLTALHAAVMEDSMSQRTSEQSVEIIKLLIESGADLEIKNSSGKRALDYASGSVQDGVAVLLGTEPERGMELKFKVEGGTPVKDHSFYDSIGYRECVWPKWDCPTCKEVKNVKVMRCEYDLVMVATNLGCTWDFKVVCERCGWTLEHNGRGSSD